MEKYRAIPEGYMTVGEIAKKMNVTVRTLQYYDKEGVLSPSLESEGGRRLYNDKDIIKLNQIQSMKYLGFSLEDIKNRLPSINTPEEVSSVLTMQTKEIREKIKHLKDVLKSLEKLNEEVLQMDVVDWAKYANIIGMLQSKIDGYWMLKYISENTISEMGKRLDSEKGRGMMNYNKLAKKVALLQNDGHAPDSEAVQAVTSEWWDFVVKATGGDEKLMEELFAVGANLNENEWKDKFSFDKSFLEEAMEIYFTSLGYNPFEG